MEKNLVIWIIGGNAVGKSTACAHLHQYFKELCEDMSEPKIIQGDDYCFTKMSKYSSNLGKFGISQCAGADTLNTKALVIKSFEEALKVTPVVMIDAILSTGTWIEFLKRDDTLVFLILLDMDEESNFKRLRKRRAKKQGIRASEVEIKPKTRENMALKLKGFRSLYLRMIPQVDFHLKFDAEIFDAEQVYDITVKEMSKWLLNTE